MDQSPNKITSKSSVIFVILLLLCGISLYFRIYLPYDTVFTGEGIRFIGVDPWYHMRLVENLIHHFPSMISFDPYTFYPYGQKVAFAPLYDFIIALFAWIIGLGHPSKQVMETVGAYCPAVLGALTVFPVYVLGKDIFSRNTGLISAALISILPGEFLARSLLGFTDHHVAEVFLSTLFIVFFVKALKFTRKDISIIQLFKKDRINLKYTLIYSLLSGITLASYLLAWTAGLFLIFILLAYLICQYIMDNLRNKTSDYLYMVSVLSLSAALTIIVLFPHRGVLENLHLPALVICILVSTALVIISKLMTRGRVYGFYALMSLLAISILSLLIIYINDPAILKSFFASFKVFLQSKARLTVSEARPVLYPYGVISLPLAMWKYFTTTFLIALLSLFWLIYAVGKGARPEKLLLLVWSLVMLSAMLWQKRFAYYFAVNVALLAGYICGKMIEWSGLSKKESSVTDVRERTKARIRQFVAAAVVFLVAFYPNLRQTIATAGQAVSLITIPQEWYSSLQWMRTHTPDPFNNPDFYFALYEAPGTADTYEYPECAYGVMSWWDYGHWITYIAHRSPNANPHQKGARTAAEFFTASNESRANNILNELDSKYVVIDWKTALETFNSMAVWAGERIDNFFEIYYQRTPKKGSRRVMLYYPAYYRAMSSRLYNFGGQAVVPDHATWVVSYLEKVDKKGRRYKEMSSLELFSTYRKAKAYMADKKSSNYRIVGKSPFLSPIPLDELRSYELLHESPPQVRMGKRISYVRIFEYTGLKK